MDNKKKWLRTSEAAQYCNISTAAIRKYARDGLIGVYRVGYRTLLFDQQELDAFIMSKRHEVQSDSR